MRPLSLVFAFAFLVTGALENSPSHTASGDLPGIGTFTYTGTPVVTDTQRVVAAATLR